MIRFDQMIRTCLLSLTLLLAMLPLPSAAQDQESSGRNVMIGTGVQWVPVYPGADANRITFLPLVDTWRVGEPMTPESPDEAFGFAVLGERNKGIAVGPALTFAPGRKAEDLPGLPELGFAWRQASLPMPGRSSRCACGPNCARAWARTRL